MTLAAAATISLAFAHPARAQVTGHDMAGEHATSAWTELDAFHRHLMQAWHPAAGKNDLAPARLHATPMSDAAQAWLASTPPVSCDNAKIRDAVAKLAEDSRAFAALAAKPDVSDAHLKKSLGALHDRFEDVESSCP